ncbi:MAG: ABC-2 family transporter protein [Planctomycetota bacterium]
MFAIYRTLFKTALAQHLQYRAALLIWLLGFILEPTVFMVVWMAIAKTRGGIVGTFSTSDLALYFLASMLINHLTFDWHFYEMEPRIKNGSFSPLLLRPIHPIHADFIDNFTYKVLTFPVMCVAAAGLFFYYKPVLAVPAWSFVLFIPALIMAFTMRFLLEWTIALAAFWTTRTQAVNTTYVLLATFLSGRFTPLELFPESIRRVAEALPFRLWISFPVELVLGRMSPDEAYKNLAYQALWIVTFYALFRIVWSLGMKRYAAVGA